MDEDLDFTDDEIREELCKLGYTNVPEARLNEFKKDLGRLIRHERSKQTSQNTTLSSHVATDTSVSYENRGRTVLEPRTRVPLEESPPDQYNLETSQDDRRQFSHLRYGKENLGCDHDESPEPVHHIPRRPDADYTLYDRAPAPANVPDDVSEADSERRMVKRKVLRKEKDGSKRIDESMTESDFGSLMDINERLKELGLGDRVDLFAHRRPQSARTEPPYRLAADDPRPASDLVYCCACPSFWDRQQVARVSYTRAPSNSVQRISAEQIADCVILRRPEHPHTRNLKKNDPVARYQQFQQSWKSQKAPGEKNHKNLRWNVREMMLTQDVVYEKKPQKVYVPNTYAVPSNKKMSELRWQVRMDMAQGQLPHHGFYQEY